MPVRFSGSGHIFAGESTADDSVIVMLHSATTQFDVVEARSISGDPNVASSLKLGVDDKTSKVLIHFQTCSESDLIENTSGLDFPRFLGLR